MMKRAFLPIFVYCSVDKRKVMVNHVDIEKSIPRKQQLELR
jgi:hypothetical protein